MRTQRTWKVRGLAALALTIVGAAFTGCANDQAQRLSLLEQENIDLRARAAQLQTRLNDAEEELSEAERRAREAAAEADRLRDEQVARPADTGFEGLAGVSSSVTGGGEVILDIAGDVLFDSGRAALKSSAKQTLDSIAGTLNSRYGGRLIRVAGHTDTDPIRKSKWKTNERLSAERALAVEEYLASKGVSPSRMYVAAYGSAYPEATKSESRRVEIIIMNEPAS